MKEQDFNPIIEAVTTIRHLATSVTGNWSTMKSVGATLDLDLDSASQLINSYGETETKEQWNTLMEDYRVALAGLKEIMSSAIDKIKKKDAMNVSENWEKHPAYSDKIEETYKKLEHLGQKALPENKMGDWNGLWQNMNSAHQTIKNEANAVGTHLKLIETNNPDEVDELTETILKHIPMKYSSEEVHRYTDEYMKAYEEIKKEASQKKNLWDRFLHILAGGAQQTPAQRVMMQRWVNGEIEDSH